MTGRRRPTRRTLAGATVGRGLVAAAALVPAVGAFLADWDETHVYNPRWPPHAKFHNGQTITTAVALAATTVVRLRRPAHEPASLRTTTLLAGLYWATQVPSAFFPGAALTDPETPRQPFRWHGLPVNQVTATGAVVLPLLAAGHLLQRRALAPPS